MTALLLTLAVEVPLYVVALVGLRLASWRRSVLLAVGVNLVTHPVLWAALGERPALGWVVLAEALVWAAEALVLWVALRRGFVVLCVLSVGANAASVLAGAVIAAGSA